MPLVQINTAGQLIPEHGKIRTIMQIAYNGIGEFIFISDEQIFETEQLK